MKTATTMSVFLAGCAICIFIYYGNALKKDVLSVPVTLSGGDTENPDRENKKIKNPEQIFSQIGGRDVARAIQDAQGGNYQDLVRITSMVRQEKLFEPTDDQLDAAATLLKSDCPFIKYFAITVLLRNPRQADSDAVISCLNDIQQRLEESGESQENIAALGYTKLSIGAYFAAYNKSDDTPVQDALVSALSKDINTEGGGGIMHQAMARKGSKGLQALVASAMSENEKQRYYAGHAISHINDPSLTGSLIAYIENPEMSSEIKFDCLNALEEIYKLNQDETIKNYVWSYFTNTNNDPDLRSSCVRICYSIDKEKTVEKLKEQLNGAQESKKYKDFIADYLVSADPKNLLEKEIELYLSGKRSYSHLSTIFSRTSRKDDAENAEVIKQLLKAKLRNGRPDNSVRMEAWIILHNATGILNNIELDYTDDMSLYSVASGIRVILERKHVGKGYDEKPIVMQELKKLVTQYHQPNLTDDELLLQYSQSQGDEE